ncbi:gliding motility-associated protein GldE [uncultured Alistipes sp.]|uniref:gliding motility-associated protein GldE n=1 Tax=uncultured Alistipes sp. TaxID=538949 RepID=UPI00262372BE|nr:gliding motility-associated protein GldE [uncultured Alistipes sp.]
MIACLSYAVVFHAFGWHEGLTLAAIVLLLLCSALVSGSEAAFFSLSPRNIAHLKSVPDRSGRAILRLLGMPDYLLASILIANNLVNICIVILSNGLIDSLIDFGGARGVEFLVKMVIVTFLLLLFGEIMPKIFASYNPLRMARITAVPLSALGRLFRPLSWLLIRSGSYINESVAKKKVNISIDELSNAIEMTSDQSAEEKQMLSGIVDFVHTEVVEIMKPRIDVVALDLRDGFDRVREVIIASGFSRIPVYEESLDNVKGVLYVKDLLPYVSHDDAFEWRNLIRKPYFVPEHKKINELLEEFQTHKIHVAIVVDEYGSTLGLVSLEDILEEIVGEISDESDVEQSFYSKLAPNVYLFDGKTHLNDFLKVLGLDDDYLDEVKGEAETIAGLMLEIRKDFLRQGERLSYRDLKLKVEAVAGRRIDKIEVTFGPTPPAEA